MTVLRDIATMVLVIFFGVLAMFHFGARDEEQASTAWTATTEIHEPIVLEPVDESPHECGNGPVEVAIQMPVPCKDSMHCALIPAGDGSYIESCEQLLVQCWDERVEVWTDWPECGGECLDQCGLLQVAPGALR